MAATDRLLAAVAALVNRAVELDPDAPARLERLNGRPLAIAIDGAGWVIQITPVGAAVELTTDTPEPPAARISGPPASLLALAGREGTRVMFSGALRVDGEVTAAREWKRLFDTLEPDWEEALARMAGDVPAHEASRVAALVAAWARRARAGRAADVRAWFVNELALLPARAEVEGWLDEVDRMRADSDRLAARVARLERWSRGS